MKGCLDPTAQHKTLPLLSAKMKPANQREDLTASTLNFKIQSQGDISRRFDQCRSKGIFIIKSIF